MGVNDFFYIIAPWEVQHPSGNDSLVFMPMCPRVRTCDGSVSDKISMCDGFFTEALNYHLQAGKGGQPALVKFASECLGWIGDKCPDDEEFDTMVSTMTTCLKAILCISDPTCLTYQSALVTMAGATSTEFGKACLRHLNLAVKRSAYYTDLKAEPALSGRRVVVRAFGGLVVGAGLGVDQRSSWF